MKSQHKMHIENSAWLWAKIDNTTDENIAQRFFYCSPFRTDIIKERNVSMFIGIV